MEEKIDKKAENRSVNISIDMNKLEGIYANEFQVMSSGQESRVDFIYVDRLGDAESNELMAKMVVRVNMTSDSLSRLRDLLNAHFEKNQG